MPHVSLRLEALFFLKVVIYLAALGGASAVEAGSPEGDLTPRQKVVASRVNEPLLRTAARMRFWLRLTWIESALAEDDYQGALEQLGASLRDADLAKPDRNAAYLRRSAIYLQRNAPDDLNLALSDATSGGLDGLRVRALADVELKSNGKTTGRIAKGQEAVMTKATDDALWVKVSLEKDAMAGFVSEGEVELISPWRPGDPEFPYDWKPPTTPRDLRALSTTPAGVSRPGKSERSAKKQERAKEAHRDDEKQPTDGKAGDRPATPSKTPAPSSN